MISRIRQILAKGCRLSGIRGCMAAGAVTAGIAAFAVIGSAGSDSVSNLNLETDVIPEDAAVTEAQTEKRTYSRDIDFLFDEDTAAAKETADEEQSAADSSEDIPEEEAQTEDIAPAAEAYEKEVSEASEAESEAGEYTDNEEAPAEEEPANEEAKPAAEAEEPEDTENEISEDSEAEDEALDGNSDSVTARSSAANGDEENGGLSSALDLEIDDEAVPAADYDNEEAEEDASEESTEEAAAEAEDEDDLDDIPEDITLDDEDEDNDSAPQEEAISLLELPQWLQFDENGVPTEYAQVLSGKACAYTAEPDALMSTGKEVFQGYVAVDPDIIPYGSELYIVAEDGDVYGYAIAADTGYSVRKGHIIVDLFMNEYDDCIQWGNKTVNVYVLKCADADNE
ncbi:MAG: 3D domain-containing protein [Oscillospiraceae bacterium]|nr:3D domain-containing protein [Oscillospiraceae bacterium]